MAKLSKDILTMTIIRKLPEKDVESIAGERPEDAKKRNDIEQNLKIMEAVLKRMEQYRDHSQHTPELLQ